MRKKQYSIAGNFRYLFHKLYSFQKYSILLPILASIMQIIVSLLIIYIPKMILDTIGQKSDFQILLYWIVVSGVCLSVCSILNLVLHNQIISCSQEFLYTYLIRTWEEKMMSQDYETFSSYRGKVNAQKAWNAISSPNWGVVSYLSSVTELLESSGGFFAYSAIVCMLHPIIIILLLILFAVEMWYGVITERRKQSLKDERASVDRRLNYIAYGTRGIQEGKDIRIYSMVTWLREIARSAVKDKKDIESRGAAWECKKMMLDGLLIALRDGCAYFYLLYRYFHTEMSIGEFTLYFAAIAGLGNWLGKITQSYSGFIEANNFVDDFQVFMKSGKKRANISHTISELSRPVSFTWENVSFSYEQEPVLKDISLEIKAGEKIAIVGANGAGKTTFIKLLCGMLTPQSGKILVNGRNINKFDPQDYLKLFSAVFQKSGVLPISIRDNIALNVRDHVDDELILKCIRDANLEKKIDSLPNGIEACLGKHIAEDATELSGGEFQRLLLARALYKDAPVLILDEPTAALDPIAENEIYQKYSQFSEGKTSIFISHRLASTRFCDRILFMDNGRIVECGTHDELMKQNGKYARLYAVQGHYYQREIEL